MTLSETWEVNVHNKALELWGGHECTVNRVGDLYFDQTILSGHHTRPADLDLFAGLGLRALRYPILWERVAPNRPDHMDWAWTDERLRRIRALGMGVIAGLVHHGSGPRYTHLLDDGFAPGLASFARAAAERYPDVRDWTPINEPLTTARFSALYGHWYPHKANERSFWIALLNQIDAIRFSMREIRRVNPMARLIQTEDLGRTYATGPTRPQADFDNQRRWMTWDLLCGRVTRDHGLWSRLAKFGFSDRLSRIADDPCPPTVIGVNHYVTSDRFLDHRWWDYPQHVVGGNHTLRFADVEAVRAILPAPDGLEGALTEAWARYGISLAVTESHLNCTRENQIHWLTDGWRTATRLKAAGVDIEAVTLWSLLGAHGWDSLLTKVDGRYESGAFDIRSGHPRPTAIARAAASLSKLEPEQPDPIAGGSGWWLRDVRLVHRPFFRSVQDPQPRSSLEYNAVRGAPLLITGATGPLGQAIARACEWRGLSYATTDRMSLAPHQSEPMGALIERIRPWAVVDAAGWVAAGLARTAPTDFRSANLAECEDLARACKALDIAYVGFSSDQVFDGKKGSPYTEHDPVHPLNTLGERQAAAETTAAALGGKFMMVRTAAVFSPFDSHNLAAIIGRNLRAEARIEVAQDVPLSLTYLPDLVDTVLDLLIDGETGLWHLVNPGAVTWAQFAMKLARALGLDERKLVPRPWKELGGRLSPPAAVELTSIRGGLLPNLDDAIGRYAGMLLSDHVAWDDAMAPTPYRKVPQVATIEGKVVRGKAAYRPSFQNPESELS